MIRLHLKATVAALQVLFYNNTKGKTCISNLCLRNESPGSPLQLNQLRTAASDTGLAVVTHALISNGCHSALSRMIVSRVCMQMSSQVVFAKATEGITRNLTSGDLGGDVEGGDRDLCGGGGAKDTVDAQNL